MAAISKLNLTFVDRFGKSAGVGFGCTALSAGNFATVTANLNDIVTAILAVTLLERTKDQRIAGETKYQPDLPTDVNAVIGNRWLVRGVDTNGNACIRQIPGADLSLAGAGGYMDLTAGAGLALKTALDAEWKSNDGEAVVVQSVLYLDK